MDGDLPGGQRLDRRPEPGRESGAHTDGRCQDVGAARQLVLVQREA